jgi:hypothetical protein
MADERGTRTRPGHDSTLIRPLAGPHGRRGCSFAHDVTAHRGVALLMAQREGRVTWSLVQPWDLLQHNRIQLAEALRRHGRATEDLGPKCRAPVPDPAPAARELREGWPRPDRKGRGASQAGAKPSSHGGEEAAAAVRVVAVPLPLGAGGAAGGAGIRRLSESGLA